MSRRSLLLALAAALTVTGCGASSRRVASGARTPDHVEAVSNEEADPEHADDGVEAPPVGEGSSGPLPFADLTDAEIAARLEKDIGALGSMSIGPSHAGVLVAGVQMPEGASWEVVSPSVAWGTKETVEALAHAIDAVAARFPSTPKLFVGNISRRQGGHFPPHISHQSGRDVDVGYYLTEGHHWYATARASWSPTGGNGSNLDRARTWYLVRTLIADTDVALILIDLQIQRTLKAYALEIGEDPAWVDQIFQAGGKGARPLILHAKGHTTHFHVRFYSPMAQELGRRAYPLLLSRRIVSPPALSVTHTVKPGETLSHLAIRYKVSADAIKKANTLKSDVLVVNKAYKIPQAGGIVLPERVVVPPRRVPPSPR